MCQMFIIVVLSFETRYSFGLELKGRSSIFKVMLMNVSVYPCDTSLHKQMKYSDQRIGRQEEKV